MTQRFLQLHTLTPLHPSNLNRDDLGYPKTAMFGAGQRLRLSSQSVKRAWRQSELFKQALGENMGTRTRRVGEEAWSILKASELSEKEATAACQQITQQFGKIAEKNPYETRQLVFVTPEEQRAVVDLAKKIASRNVGPEAQELQLLKHTHSAADVAMFGRFFADATNYNVEAAVQVAHSLTTNVVNSEIDYFTAVDDLSHEDESGAGHLGEGNFGSGLFYQYVCVDNQLLLENLNGDQELAKRALAALTECAVKVFPSGKQASYGSRVCSVYVLAELGSQQPRSLTNAFWKPLAHDASIADYCELLEQKRKNYDDCMSTGSNQHYIINVEQGTGKLVELLQLVQGGIDG